MKKKLLFALLIILTSNSFSQDSKFSLELNFPIPFGNNLIGQNYNGIVDLGASYKFANIAPINIGASLNTGILINNANLINRFPNFNVISYVIQPKVFGELNLGLLENFHPSLGLGYTVIITSANNRSDIIDLPNNTESGINFNLGLAYDITQKLFIKSQYDFIKLSANDNSVNNKFNTNVNILKIGFGYRF